MTSIHPTAIVNPKAELGENVSVGPYTIIEGDVQIGDNTTIASQVLIADGARIGSGCRIHHGAVIATLPQDLKFGGEKTTFEIGNNTTVREFCTLNRGTQMRGKSVVGSNCLLMAYTHVAHDCIVGDNVILANAVQLAGHVTVEDWAIIGGLTGVHQFCRIGRHVMVGGHFRVTKDVPPYILASEEPLRFVGLNSVGLRRRGFPEETMRALKHAYRLIYRSNLNVSQAVARIREEVELIPEVLHILEFIEKAERGII
ncbi:MAG: acyl-ACP--UDP-N-acetylglucosamine O-acyltransferase [candidate division KSB1 bacterium]|nr:acyl-ACP--UDP-N-acetylglucosamine O-acyltransferase [candidate division KSB1 bacterium]